MFRVARWAPLLIVTCCVSQFAHTVYSSVITVSLPAISREFDANMDALQWLVNAYTISLASLLTCAGVFADRYGRKRVLLLGNVVMIAGSILCATAMDIPLLIAGRVVQGIGSAMIAPAGLSLLTTELRQRRERARAIVWWTTVGTVSLAAGPILGGVLVRDLGWQSLFWAGVPLEVISVVGVVVCGAVVGSGCWVGVDGC